MSPPGSEERAIDALADVARGALFGGEPLFAPPADLGARVRALVAAPLAADPAAAPVDSRGDGT